jgi:hypothetical protein
MVLISAGNNLETVAVIIGLDLHELNRSSCLPGTVCATIFHMECLFAVVNILVLRFDDVIQM